MLTEISQPAFIWIVLLIIDMALMVLFFSDVGRKEYWANVVFAGICYFISTGLSTMVVSGAVSLGADGAAGVSADEWLANILAWHSYFMLVMAGFAVLKNTLLAPEREPKKKN